MLVSSSYDTLPVCCGTELRSPRPLQRDPDSPFGLLYTRTLPIRSLNAVGHTRPHDFLILMTLLINHKVPSMTASLNRLDLNLLRVFSAVMEENSVLRASQRVCLSQSAVSHALARLRGMLDDELFIRTPTGMKPTARALAMAPLIREAWRSLEMAIGNPRFEPSKSTTQFVIVASELVTTVVVPKLLELLRREAPLVNLIIRPDCGVDLTEQIHLGKVDAAIGVFSQVPERLRSLPLFTFDDVLVTNSSKRLGKLSPNTLFNLNLAAVSLHSEYDGLADGPAAQSGLSRRSEMFDRAALEAALGSTNGIVDCPLGSAFSCSSGITCPRGICRYCTAPSCPVSLP